MKSKGYVKFQQRRIDEDAVRAEDIKELNVLRAMFRENGLIGERLMEVPPDDRPELVGYGNVSARKGDTDEFMISGTRTGGLPVLGPEHYALITRVDIENNFLECRGRIDASAESLTHAGIYLARNDVRFAVHVHNLKLWEDFYGRFPTTPDGAQYGTPEIAEAIRVLCDSMKKPAGVIVMGGHKEGLMLFGRSVEEVCLLLESLSAGDE